MSPPRVIQGSSRLAREDKHIGCVAQLDVASLLFSGLLCKVVSCQPTPAPAEHFGKGGEELRSQFVSQTARAQARNTLSEESMQWNSLPLHILASAGTDDTEDIMPDEA